MMKTSKCIAVVGLGRTGSRLALLLLKLGQRELVLIDRDYLEPADLRDSTLYQNSKLFEPKAIAAKRALDKIFPSAKITAYCQNLDELTVNKLLQGSLVVCDNTDNWLARHNISNYCWKKGKPWVYCASLATTAMASTIYPGKRPCWNCWNPHFRLPVSCAVAGFDSKVTGKIVKVAVKEACRLISGKNAALVGKLRVFYSLREQRPKTIDLVCDPKCALCGIRKDKKTISKPPAVYVLCGSGQYQFINEKKTY